MRCSLRIDSVTEPRDSGLTCAGVEPTLSGHSRGSRRVVLRTGTLTPSTDVGLRHDAGDAETGTGVEVGGGMRYEGDRWSMDGSARTLLVHEAGGYEEWGASGRGLSLTVAPAWGAAGSNVEVLWGSRTLKNSEGGSSSPSAGSRPRSGTDSQGRGRPGSSPRTRGSHSQSPGTARGGSGPGGRSLRRSRSDSRGAEQREEKATPTTP